MSSFYGSGFYGGSEGSSSSGGGFTTLTGTQDSPIILSTLNEGHYIIEGYYLYTKQDEILKTQEGGLGIHITIDETNNQKVGVWESYNNSTVYINVINFQTDDSYVIDKIAIRNSGQGDNNVIFVNALPTVGEEDTLYVTSTSIFKYVDGNYVNLTNNTWIEFD